MDPDARKVTIEHGEPCACRVDGGAVYARWPCVVRGHRVTKGRVAQLAHAIRNKRRDSR